jgi:type VI secretion system protein ImpK
MTASQTNFSMLPIAFRDTALTVVQLGRRNDSPSFESLRLRCREQIQHLRGELKMASHADDVIHDAVYAQCALLDETALRHLNSRDRDAWEREPLQVAEFGTHDAGEALIALMHKRLQQPQSSRPLLEIFFVVLALGFKGRFALERPGAHDAMIRMLRDRLDLPGENLTGVIVRSGSKRSFFARLSLPFFVLLALVTTVIVWVLLDRWLNGAAAQLLQ